MVDRRGSNHMLSLGVDCRLVVDLCTMSHLIAPSVLAANFGNLERDLEMINRSDADWLHVDIMDGHFVPNISFGPSICKTMHDLCEKPLDVHLMLADPDRYIQDFVEAGAAVLTVHLEACSHLHRTIEAIRSKDIKVGVALNPHSSVDLLDDVLEDLDLVCLMSVNPGFGGQKFIYRTLAKVEQLKEKIIVRNLDTLIEIDGGVGLQNAEKLLQAGADVLVAGSSVFKSEDPAQTITALKQLQKIRSI